MCLRRRKGSNGRRLRRSRSVRYVLMVVSWMPKVKTTWLSYLLLCVGRLLAKGRVGTMTVHGGVWRLVEWLTSIRRGRRGTITPGRSGTSAAHLVSHLLLLSLQGRCPGLDQGVLDGFDNVTREYWRGVDGSGHGFLPGLQHLLQLMSGSLIDRGVHIHEALVEVLSEEESVRRANVLDNGVQQVDGWEFSLWWGLVQMSAKGSGLGDGDG